MITDEKLRAVQSGEVLSLGEFRDLFPRQNDINFMRCDRDQQAAIFAYDNLMARLHVAEDSLKQAADAAGDLLAEDPPDMDGVFTRVKHVVIGIASPWIRRHSERMTKFIRHYETNLLKHSKYRRREAFQISPPPMNIRHPLPAAYQNMSIADLRDSMNVALHKIEEDKITLAQKDAIIVEEQLCKARWQASYDGAMRENKNQQHAYNLMKIESEQNAGLLAVRDREIADLNVKIGRDRAMFMDHDRADRRKFWMDVYVAAIRHGGSTGNAHNTADNAVSDLMMRISSDETATKTPLPHE